MVKIGREFPVESYKWLVVGTNNIDLNIYPCPNKSYAYELVSKLAENYPKAKYALCEITEIVFGRILPQFVSHKEMINNELPTIQSRPDSEGSK